MKYCNKIHEYLYIDHFDGGVFLCPWMDPKKACIGNIYTDSIEDMYNSDYANYLRSTIEDQSFCHCRPEACPFIQNRILPEISEEEYEQKKKAPFYPNNVNMAFDFVCNQSCETCRKTVFVPPTGYKEKMDIIQEKLKPVLDTAKQISASGHGDPFASPYMMNILEKLNPTNPDLKILLETNGVFFDEEHWERIKHLGNFRLEVVITSNSFDPFTYKHISRNGNYEKLMKNLSFASSLREKGYLKKLTHCLVIQDRNFREIPSFIERSLRDYSFDEVVLRPVYQWGTMDEKVYWFKDVLNPMHPYHKEYLEIMENPILKDPHVFNFGGDTEHVARPYPTSDDIFPYSQVKQGSKVVVYGAGMIGNQIVDSVNSSEYCCVKLWVDQCGDGDCVKKPDVISDLKADEYDAVIVATIKPNYASEMIEELTKLGVPCDKIVNLCK